MHGGPKHEHISGPARPKKKKKGRKKEERWAAAIIDVQLEYLLKCTGACLLHAPNTGPMLSHFPFSHGTRSGNFTGRLCPVSRYLGSIINFRFFSLVELEAFRSPGTSDRQGCLLCWYPSALAAQNPSIERWRGSPVTKWVLVEESTADFVLEILSSGCSILFIR